LSKIGKFSTHHVPDKGIWYEPGELVHLRESRNGIEIFKDPTGTFEVHSCRRATEYRGTPALLRVGLRKHTGDQQMDPKTTPYVLP
jgi:hypothetical protein